MSRPPAPKPALKPAPKSRKARRSKTGGYARGDRARMKIISAAIEAFGKCGYEAASTRMIAKRARANLGSLQYYFGSKSGLYLACADHIADRVSPQIDTLAETLGSMMPAENTLTERHIEVLSSILALAAERIISGGKNSSWLMFVGREQTSPGRAFDILHEKVIRRVIALFSTLVGRIVGDAPESEQTVLSTLVLLGPLFMFQRGRGIVLRTLDWPDIDAARMEQIKAVLIPQALRGLVAFVGEETRR